MPIAGPLPPAAASRPPGCRAARSRDHRLVGLVDRLVALDATSAAAVGDLATLAEDTLDRGRQSMRLASARLRVHEQPLRCLLQILDREPRLEALAGVGHDVDAVLAARDEEHAARPQVRADLGSE